MNSRVPDTPPQILPLDEDVERPLWSVMIPAYNCISYLRETLESVLAQDPGPEKMQIEVVDDCSTDGDVYALVEEVGKGRVGFYRQDINRGSLRNFETCLNRAKGNWVHLLHGDDKVKVGFYQEIETLFNQYPEAGAAFTRHSFIDEGGHEFYTFKAISKEPGLLHNWLYTIAQRNKLQPPAIVVKRSVFEQLGGFFAVHFGEDWEMWVRIASKFPFAYSPQCLAQYRKHTNNVSSRSFLSGQNIEDINRVIDIIQVYLPYESRKELKQRAKKNASRYFAKTARRVFNKHHSPKAAFIQAKGAFNMHINMVTLGYLAVLSIEYFIYCFKRLAFNRSQKAEAGFNSLTRN
jgi:glycosyltransferase involved in cell wall biosynthesis